MRLSAIFQYFRINELCDPEGIIRDLWGLQVNRGVGEWLGWRSGETFG
jgi:hypothetical protein